MANILHSTLTGGDLHECKGASSAPAGTVPIANGSGSAPFGFYNYSNLSNKPSIPSVYAGATNLTNPLIKTYTAVCTAGVFTVPLTGFTTVSGVQVTPVATANTLGATCSAGVNSVSTTSVSGYVVVHSASANALGTTQTVYVTVIGV